MKDFLTISASSLLTFQRCSQQYKWQFLDELPQDPGTASLHTIFGSAIHKCMELHFKHGIEVIELKGSWKVLFLTLCSEIKNLNEPSKSELKKFIDKGYVYLDNLEKMGLRWKNFKVLSVEGYYKFPYTNVFVPNVFLSGRMDLLLGNDDMVVCLDWKTAKSKENDVENNIQLTFYIYFMSMIYDKYVLEQFHAGLAYPFDCEILFTQRKSFEKLFDKIDKMLERIANKDFKKEPKMNFRPDDCHFCQYKTTCNSK